jgi:hypothetical protein
VPVFFKILIFMLSSAGIFKSQTTYTANLIVADSAKVSYSRSDSIRTEFLRVTDSVCTAKGMCVGQEAKVGGNLSVGGDIVFSNSTLGFRVSTAPMLNNTRILNIGDFAITSKSISTIPNLPCFTSSQYSSSPLYVMANGGGFISRYEDQAQNTDQSLVMFQRSWGQAHIESEGTYQNNTSPYPNNPLLINYFCNNDVAIGTGPASANGKFSRVYVGNFLRANKHVEIGDSLNGITGDNSNIGLLVHTHSGAGVKVRTYNGSLNALSVQNTGNQAPDDYGGLHTFSVRGDGQTTILTKGTNAALTVKQFNNASNTPTVFQVMGDGRTYIGKQKPLSNGVHADAMLSVDGKVIAKKFYVTVQPGTWGDYIFDESYRIPELEYIKKFIKEYKHLPGMESAKTIEEKGLDLGEFNAELLKLLEMAYLYIIKLEDRLSKIEIKNKQL